MKVLFFANTDWYLYNFRLALIQHVRQQGHEVILVSPPGSYGPLLQSLGFKWIPFSFSRSGSNPFREFITIKKLVQLYRMERPDLAHHFTIKCVIYGGIAGFFSGCKGLVSSVTGLGHLFTSQTLRTFLTRPVARWLYRFVLRRSRVIFQNSDDRDAFLTWKLVDPNSCVVIRGSGVDVAHFVPRTERKSTHEIVVLFVGRLIAEKGIHEYVEAARHVCAEVPGVRFVAAGTPDAGNPTSVDNRTLKIWQSEGLVEFVGHQSDMRELLAGTDVAVLPSYREGTPRSLLEAAASGLPLVATDVPGCREVVRHEWNGLLVPAKDAAALSQAIIRLARNRQLRHAMGMRSRELVVGHFSSDLVISATLAAYECALANEQ